MSNTKKAGRNTKNHHAPGHTDELDLDATPTEHDQHDPSDTNGYAAEHAREESRQSAMAAREKAMRTQMSAGQANTMRLKRANQPRGNR
ncbi:MAG: hypothetical protein HOV79_22635 [Hamadaea sp.]|nr:hypothetical protein [Hamadaea sp.]